MRVFSGFGRKRKNVEHKYCFFLFKFQFIRFIKTALTFLRFCFVWLEFSRLKQDFMCCVSTVLYCLIFEVLVENIWVVNSQSKKGENGNKITHTEQKHCTVGVHSTFILTKREGESNEKYDPFDSNWIRQNHNVFHHKHGIFVGQSSWFRGS